MSIRAVSCGTTRWSIPTTAALSTSARAGPCWHRSERPRREHPELFSGYTPVRAAGAAAPHALAFDRGGAISVSTRLPVRLHRDGGWRDTTLRLGTPHRDAFTGDIYTADVPLGELLKALPVALLLPA